MIIQEHKKELKIMLFGTPDFAIPTLNILINFGYDVVAVVTQPEKPVGRARVVMMPSPVKKAATEKNITIFEPHNLKQDEEFFERFKKLDPDLCVVAAYGKIIPKRYLDIPKYGFVNIHPSLLPKYRGPSPIQTAILDGSAETGVTIMLMNEEVDHGPILATSDWPIANSKYYKELEKELAELGAKLLVETLPKYINGDLEPKPQDHNKATFTKMIKRGDGRIDWNQPAKQIYNQIRALNPEPGTWTTWNGKVINIPTCDVGYPQEKEKPGTVTKKGANIAVATKTNYLILKQIQLEGGKEMSVNEFVNGHGDFVGSLLEERLNGIRR